LRFRLAFGTDAGEELAHQGHGYLGYVTFAAGPLLALVMALWLVRLASPRATMTTGRSFGFGSWSRAWVTGAAALFAIYAGQELLEGVFAAGHPTGLDGVLGEGGWLALPLSVLLGGTVAAGLGVAHALERRTATSTASFVPPPIGDPVLGLSVAPATPRGLLLARQLAGRGPPLRSV